MSELNKLSDLILDKQSLIQAIMQVEEIVTRIPKTEETSLQAINILLTCINTYVTWIEGLKTEILKLDSLNQALRKKLVDAGLDPKSIILPVDFNN